MAGTGRTVTRVDLCEAVYQKVGLSRTESSAFVELVLKEITDCLERGETVKLSYVDQSRTGIDPNKNVWEVVSDGLDWIKVGNVEMPSRAYVSVFGFKGPDQQKQATNHEEAIA